MSKLKIEYPNIVCDAHPGIVEPGYFKCRHVFGPKDVAYFEVATKAECGTVCCHLCADKLQDRKYVMDNFDLCCAQGMREVGFNLQEN